MITEAKPRRPLVGTMVTITATFTNATGVPTDPVDPTIFIEKPDETEIVLATSDLAHIGTGIWRGNVHADQPGQWYARAFGTETIAAVQEGFFIVRPSILTNDPVVVNDYFITQDGFYLITQAGDNLVLES